MIFWIRGVLNGPHFWRRTSEHKNYISFSDKSGVHWNFWGHIIDFPKAYTMKLRNKGCLCLVCCIHVGGKQGMHANRACVDPELVVLPHLVLRFSDHLEVPIA